MDGATPIRTRSGRNVYRRAPASPRVGSRAGTPNGHAAPPSPSLDGPPPPHAAVIGRSWSGKFLDRVKEEEIGLVWLWRRWKKYEVPRKVLHSSIGFVTIFFVQQHLYLPTLARCLAVALAIIASADVLRFRWPAFERTYESLLGSLMRESEKKGEVNGTIYYLVGVLVVLAFYPRDIAVLSILFLSWVDTFASITGRKWGRYTPKLPRPFGRKKSFAGFFGGWLTGTLTALLFWTLVFPRAHENTTSWAAGPAMPVYFGRLTPPPFAGVPQLPNPQCGLSLAPLAVLSGLAAAVAEAIDLWGLDDNLTIPVLSGLFLWGVMRAF